ncbi:MAG: methyltransferase domain-containing protein, partial [Pseudomonadota bacterium]
AEFVETGTELSRWVGLSDRIDLHHGSALDMPFADGAFDGAMMLHVGMNIADKVQLFAEVARVLRPGAPFGVFDVMRIGEGDLTYPVPWSGEPATNALAPPEDYRQALARSGFMLSAERDRHAFAVEFFETLSKRIAAAGGPPPLGLHITMGETAPVKVANMVENIGAGRIAPVEMISHKPT